MYVVSKLLRRGCKVALFYLLECVHAREVIQPWAELGAQGQGIHLGGNPRILQRLRGGGPLGWVEL